MCERGFTPWVPQTFSGMFDGQAFLDTTTYFHVASYRRPQAHCISNSHRVRPSLVWFWTPRTDFVVSTNPFASETIVDVQRRDADRADDGCITRIPRVHTHNYIWSTAARLPIYQLQEDLSLKLRIIFTTRFFIAALGLIINAKSCLVPANGTETTGVVFQFWIPQDLRL